ncbi:MAG: Ig-like domain-containing protein [Firmicutes bacterium]|nr:Ig-like domain-containing protein [Bacillota bacterium]
MEAQRLEHVLNEYFRQTGEDVAQQTAPSWFEHVLRKSAYLAEKGEKPDWDAGRWAELTDMRGLADPEEQPAAADGVPPAETGPEPEPMPSPNPVIKSKGRPGRRPPKFRRAWMGSLAAALVLFIGFFSALHLLPEQEEELPRSFGGAIDVVAQSDAAGAVTSFVITSGQPLSEELVRQALTISPATEYRVALEDGGNEAVITPTGPLQAGSVYSVSFDPEQYLADLPPRASHTWAFQTESPFAVKTVHPQDLSTWVDVATGITIAFNQTVDPSAAKAVSLSPETPGQWQTEGNRLLFIPSQPLAGETVYEITLDASVSAAAGGALGEEKVYRFQTAPIDEAEEETDVSWQAENDESNFSPETVPGLSLYAWGEALEKGPAAAEAVLYAYKDTEQYAAALQERYGEYFWAQNFGEQKLPTAALKKYGSFTLQPAPAPDAGYSGRYRLTFPQALPEGSYLAELTWYGQTRQVLFTVSPLAVYIAQGESDALLWLHEGKEAAQANIRIYDGKENATAGPQGVASLALPEGDREGRTVYLIDSGEHSLAAAAMNREALYRLYEAKEDGFRFDYWHYLYADRTLYKPGDTVYLFGVAQAKQGASAIDRVELRLTGGNLPAQGDALTWELPVEDGVYSGEISLPQLQEGYYTLEAVCDGGMLDSVFFQVADYDLPSFKIQVTCDRQAAMIGDRVNWTMEAAYFDGTPAANVSLSYSFWDQPEAQAVTDSNGRATVETVLEGDVLGWDYILYPAGLFVRATLPEGGEVYADGYCDVFLNREEAKGELTAEGDAYRLTLEGYSVDLTDIQPYEGDEELKEQAFTRLSQPLNLHAELIHCGFRQEKESKYNAYTQQLEESIRYVSYEETEDQFDLTLNDSRETSFRGTLAHPQDAYRLELTGQDAAGRELKRLFYLWRQDEYRSYWLQSRDEEADSLYRQGETLDLYAGDGREAMQQPAGGEWLFFACQKDIIDYQVKEENLYQREFTTADAPNLHIGAVAYCDGVYHDISPYQACQDPEDYRGHIEITAGQTAYRPGDTVKLDLRFTDQTGRPVSGKIAVSVVDESLLSIAGTPDDIVSSLLDDYYPYPYQSFLWNAARESSMDSAEAMAGGMGAGENIREDFSDMACFAVVEADGQGRAVLEFTLPDDVTGWRITAQGYGPGPVCACEEITVRASLPLFVEARLGDTYRLGDRLDLGLRAAAGETAEGQLVSYRITLPQLDFSATAEGEPGAWTEIALPPLSKAGQYTLEVTAEYNGAQDRIRRIFRAVETLSGYEKIEQYALDQDFTLPQRQSDILRLYFYPTGRRQIIDGLMELSQQSGARLEQILSAQMARQALNEFFPEQAGGAEATPDGLSLLSNYQQQDGGISSFTYGQSDLLVSVLAAAAAKDRFDQRALAAYFQSFAEGVWDQETALAYWGLAALGEPVLNTMLAKAEAAGEDMDAVSQIYLALALTWFGNGSAAQPLAAEILARYGNADGELAFAAGQSLDDAALLALLAGIYDLPGSGALLDHVEENHPEDEYYLLQRLLILQSRLGQMEGDASFTYTLEGKETQVDFKDREAWGLTLDKQRADQWRLVSCQGDISVAVVSWEPGYPPESGEDPWGLEISRSYNQGAEAVSQAQPVTVTLNYRIPAAAPAGSYILVDYLPAGLDFLKQIFDEEQPEDGGQRFWHCGKEGQVLTFVAYKEAGKELSGRISYVARAQSGGSFTAEAPYLRHCLAASRGSGQEQTLTVR